MSEYDAYRKVFDSGIFAGAAHAVIETYITPDSFRIRDFAAGDAIATPEMPETQVGILLSGKAQIFSVHNSKKVLLKTMQGKEMFGVANLFCENLPFPSFVYAKSAAKVLYISADSLRRLIENDGTVLRNYLEFLSTKIVYLNRKIAILTAGTPEAKLSYLILENEKNGIFTPETPISSLATMLDTGRASLYRAFDKLVSEGYIERQGKNIVILDKERLARDFL